jgi:ethanolamine utilization protein EutJ
MSSVPTMTDDVCDVLARTAAVMDGAPGRATADGIRVGVDLGTAFTVVMVTDGAGQPLAGAYESASVTRDGVVVDFWGAIHLVKRLKEQIEERTGLTLEYAASGYPPGVAPSEVRAVEHVLEAAGLLCSGLTDEPTAANEVLKVRDGAVVDIGGGTTGVAVFSGGDVVALADEPTGGTHVSLVLAGGLGVSLAEAERAKRDPERVHELAPMVRPVFEKIGAIVEASTGPYDVPSIELVGGTCRFPGIAEVIGSVTGVPCRVPGDPLFVTPLGFAHRDPVQSGGFR